MAQPDSPQQFDDEVDRVQTLVDNARRLGLTWDLTLATISTNSPNPMGVLDGDTEPIGLIDLDDFHLAGDRVYVLKVPPSGNYIIGPAGGAGGRLIGVSACRANSAQALPSATPTTITWDTNNYDPFGYLTVPGSAVIVPPGMAGVHAITAGVNVTQSGARNFITIFNNVTRVVRSSFVLGEDYVGACAVIYLNDADQISVDAFQNSGLLGAMIGCIEVYRLPRG